MNTLNRAFASIVTAGVQTGISIGLRDLGATRIVC